MKIDKTVRTEYALSDLNHDVINSGLRTDIIHGARVIHALYEDGGYDVTWSFTGQPCKADGTPDRRSRNNSRLSILGHDDFKIELAEAIGETDIIQDAREDKRRSDERLRELIEARVPK